MYHVNIIQDKLQNQIHDKDQTIEHMSQEFQTKYALR